MKKTVNYAKALFDMGGSTQQIEKRIADFSSIEETTKQYPEIVHLLNFPDVNVEKKMAFLESILKRELEPILKKLLLLVIAQHKSDQIHPIAVAYRKLAAEGLKEVEAKVSAVDPLSDDAKQEITSFLEQKFKKKIKLITEKDPSLLGGFTIEAENQLLDMSIKNKLTSLKTALLKARL